MPSQVLTSVENNFTKGLITEFTGLNFPENAAIDCDNTEFTLIGNTTRRLGCDYETNYTLNAITRTNQAINTYKWNNVGGDGTTQLIVSQIGDTLYFYSVTASTTASPLSGHKLSSTVTLSTYLATGGAFDSTVACEFTDGNGYLFVFHPDCDPIYCTYTAGTITGNAIAVKIRDFAGVIDSLAVDNRPTTLSNPHLYNLSNQGWTQGSAWTATSTTLVTASVGSKSFTVAAGIVGVTLGDAVVIDGTKTSGAAYPNCATGNVTAYAGTTMTVNITAVGGEGAGWAANAPFIASYTISPTNHGYLTTWNTALGNYPSNSDVWWRFKNTSDVFAPATTAGNVVLGISQAPRGHFVVGAFDQQRDIISAISDITDITTLERPTNGIWFQGRVWYTGVNASQAASGTANFTTWTESIYFSQIVQGVADFGKCYQENDPTSETLFDLLPTDGGVITIQGSGAIYRLFPIQNGMLVFAANGVWFITGSQGIGFAANDYTITKLSNIHSFSCTSYVDVMGLPYFWNEEGIYNVQPAKDGGLQVNPITVGTILEFYRSIPLESKKFARGAYHPIDYVLQWIYKSTNSTNTTDKYNFDKILNFNTYNKAFYPYTIDTTSSAINGINYVSGPGGSTTVEPSFKYLCSNAVGTSMTFAELIDTDYVDWDSSGTEVDFDSYFITGYKLHGQGQRRFQVPYIYVYSNTEGEAMAYKIQSLWDYARSGDGGRWSSAQQVSYVDNIYQTNGVKRHRLRGHGLSMQIKISSVTGQPYNIIGWSMFEVQNTGV